MQKGSYAKWDLLIALLKKSLAKHPPQLLSGDVSLSGLFLGELPQAQPSSLALCQAWLEIL